MIINLNKSLKHHFYQDLDDVYVFIDKIGGNIYENDFIFDKDFDFNKYPFKFKNMDSMIMNRMRFLIDIFVKNSIKNSINIRERCDEKTDKYIEENGDCLRRDFLYCKRIIDSGKAPESWLKGINNFILINGYPPVFATDYCAKIMDSEENIPQEWIEGIHLNLEAAYRHSRFSEKYFDKMSKLKDFSEDIIIGINKYISNHGNPMSHFCDFCKNNPNLFVEGTKQFLLNTGEPAGPFIWYYLSDLLKNMENNNIIDQKWIDFLTKHFEKYHIFPQFADKYCRYFLSLKDEFLTPEQQKLRNKLMELVVKHSEMVKNIESVKDKKYDDTEEKAYNYIANENKTSNSYVEYEGKKTFYGDKNK